MHLRDNAIPQPATWGPTCLRSPDPGAKIPWETSPSAHRKAHACYPFENGILSTQGNSPRKDGSAFVWDIGGGREAAASDCRMLVLQSLVS